MNLLKTRIVINGIGVVGGFGCGVEDLNRALLAGMCKTGKVDVFTDDGRIELQGFSAKTSRLESYVPKGALRRVDHFSRMAALAGYLALEDAGNPDTVGRDMGIVIASGYGSTQTTFAFLDSIREGGDGCASPTLFSNSIHNAAAAHLSMFTKATGPNITISQFEMSVPSALLTACQLLIERRVDSVLFGGVDQYCSVLGYSWSRFFHDNELDEMRPLQLGQQSAVVGEGSAFFLLSRDEYHASPYCYIKDIMLGNLGRGPINLPPDHFIIIGADGHKRCGRHYARQIPNGSRIAVYTNLYGSLPVSPAFDTAIAALCLKTGRIFGVPKQAGENFQWQVVRQEEPLNMTPICCLKIGGNSDFGLIILDRCGKY